MDKKSAFWATLSLAIVMTASCTAILGIDGDYHKGGGGQGGGAGSGGGGQGGGGQGGGQGGGECSAANDCMMPPPCQTATCVEGKCGVENVAQGTVLPMQAKLGDCMSRTCDGMGHDPLLVDDTDVPDDTNACTKDVCSNGVPSNTPEPDGFSCGMNSSCDGAGHCKCTGDMDCMAPETCGGGNPGTPGACGCTKTTCDPKKVSCGMIFDGCTSMLDCSGSKDGDETDTDCGGTTCATKCAQGKMCSTTVDCATGHCVDGVCCDTACTGVCDACVALKTGSGMVDGTCAPIKNGTDPDSECPPQSCAGNNQTYAFTCDGNGACTSNGSKSCVPYTCSSNACFTSCSNDGQCAQGAYCAAPQCVPKQMNGASCGSAGQCQSGNCVDGVCCNDACVSPCRSCLGGNTGGVTGICGNSVAGSDPDGDCNDAGAFSCGNNGTCNGSGMCQKYIFGTVCSPASCSVNILTKAQTCDGLGTCKDNGTQNCGLFLCPSGFCPTDCNTDAQCVSGASCQGPPQGQKTCAMQKGAGMSCMAPNECVSGFCADGVCCDTVCGQCQVCNMPANPGTCSNVLLGMPDMGPPPCGGMPDPAHACNGMGACLLTTGQPCSASNQCVSNQCVGPPMMEVCL